MKTWKASTQTHKLDKIWSKLIKHRDGYKCLNCGSTENLNSMHIHSRNFRSTRWEIINGITGCAKCHMMFHLRPLEFCEFVKKTIGEGAYLALLQASAKGVQMNRMKYEEIEAKLKAEVVSHGLIL
jgi:hypothetical protein